MLSTIGTALGTTQGSCRPLARNSVSSPTVPDSTTTAFTQCNSRLGLQLAAQTTKYEYPCSHNYSGLEPPPIRIQRPTVQEVLKCNASRADCCPPNTLN
jgi:hypothetical protein